MAPMIRTLLRSLTIVTLLAGAAGAAPSDSNARSVAAKTDRTAKKHHTKKVQKAKKARAAKAKPHHKKKKHHRRATQM